MQSEAALVLLAIAVAVSSLALLAQAIVAVRIMRSVEQLKAEILPLIPQAKETLREAQEAVKLAAARIEESAEMTRRLLQAAQQQVDGIDQARRELAAQWRVQSERLELVLEDILSRVQDVVAVLHGTVMRPVREVSGMVAGVKAALQTLLMARRPTVDRATNEDELFI
ncbi:MAG: hypothetical protein KatS3mg004_1742 [Bryobacteraceae bacterium]|nr:MAG: hypothetical protein KatS3mg004_1742 [Bryobacteraceae bacterium]